MCRWSGRGSVTHGGGATSTARKLKWERGIIGTRLFTSPEAYRDNLREDEERGRGRPMGEWVMICGESHCLRGSWATEGGWWTHSQRTGAKSLGLFWYFLKRVRRHLVLNHIVCAYMHKRGYATLGIKRTMTDCVLYTLYYYFSMIYLKRKKKGTCESKCNAPFSLHFLQISVL